jgi:hypothetical protein
MYTRTQVAGIISEALGRRIEAGRIDFDAWADRVGIPDGARRRGMQRLYADYDQHGFPGGNGQVLRTILGRESRSLRQFFRELVGRAQVAA